MIKRKVLGLILIGLSQPIFAQKPLINKSLSASTQIQIVETDPGIRPLQSTWVTPADAFELVTIKITDAGDDDLPTRVKLIKLNNALKKSIALNKILGEDLLVRCDGYLVPIAECKILSKTIDITLGPNALEINDGQSKTITILGYLQKKGKLIDGDSLQLAVKQTHGFESYEGGSAFVGKIDEEQLSTLMQIQVDAKKVWFVQTPKRIGRNKQFAVTVGTTDIYGNIDIDGTGQVKLSKNLGDGKLTFPGSNVANFEKGVTTFESLTYSKTGIFSLTAQSAHFADGFSDNITCGDADALIVNIANETDTAYLASTNTEPAQAAEVMRFRIVDRGTSDGLPTIPIAFTLNTFNPLQIDQLANAIGGILVETNTGLSLPTTLKVSGDKISIDVPEYELVISDGDSIDLSLKIYLKRTGIADGQTFRFFIEGNNHAQRTSTAGTDYASNFQANIYGKICKIYVKASQVQIADYPFQVAKNQPFSVKALACDLNGNVDLNYNLGQASLCFDLVPADGKCDLPRQSTDLKNGVACWDSLKINKLGEWSLKTSASGMQNTYAQPLFVGYDLQTVVDEDFEGELPNWNGINSWALSGSAMQGKRSLVHAGNAQTPQSVLTYDVNLGDAGRSVEWRVTLGNGNFDPSESTTFYMVLAATSDNFDAPDCSGLAMGIDPSASTDRIVLWRFDGKQRSTLVTSTLDWDENQQITLRATLTPSGTISLWHRKLGEQIMLLDGSATVRLDPNYTHGGFVYKYLASRAGLLWIDDVQIRTMGYLPVIEAARILNNNSISLKISKPVDATQAANVANYSLSVDNGPITINQAQLSPDRQQVMLQTQDMPQAKVNLHVQNIADDDGNLLDQTLELMRHLGSFGSLIINEIMADPSNSQGLPNCEWLELYNPGDRAINLKDWTLTFNKTKITLPETLIEPDSFAIVCAAKSEVEMSIYGQCVVVETLPSITNDGMLIKLSGPGGALISFADFNKTWYADPAKLNGGFSLERIDANNYAEQGPNWLASNAANGGTPGAKNSVAGENPDTRAPHVDLQLLDDRNLNLIFSEPMDTLNFTHPGNYLIDNGQTPFKRLFTSDETFRQLRLEFGSPLTPGTVHTLDISPHLTDFSGNQLLNGSVEFMLSEEPAPGDVVINEVLFNPFPGGVDFVELYNRSNRPFDLNRLYLCNRNASGNFESVNRASDRMHLLHPQSFAVVTTNPALVEQFYHVQNVEGFAPVSKMAAFNTESGCVVLLTPNQEVIDEFCYTDKMHNRLLTDLHGVSLERVNPEQPSDAPQNWHSAAQTAGFATPTYKNSQYSDAEPADDTFSLQPETFSPDGDGTDDHLLINYRLPEPGFVANIRIYNSAGVEVYRLANNATLGTEGTFTWDGQNSRNTVVPIGIYIVHIEYRDLNGKVKTKKLVCVVAKYR